MNQVYAGVIKALKEAIDFAEGKISEAMIHNVDPIDVEDIRAEHLDLPPAVYPCNLKDAPTSPGRT